MKRGRILLSLLAVAVVMPAAWAYVNGGDHHSTRRQRELELRRGGWTLVAGEDLPSDWKETRQLNSKTLDELTAENPRSARDWDELWRRARIKFDPADNADFQRYVNKLVGRALKALPEEETDKIPLEVKRDAARRIREALHDVLVNGINGIKEGQAGSLKYRVGVYSYATWWETNYGGKHRIHARRNHSAPFIALKIAEDKDEAGK